MAKKQKNKSDYRIKMWLWLSVACGIFAIVSYGIASDYGANDLVSRADSGQYAGWATLICIVASIVCIIATLKLKGLLKLVSTIFLITSLLSATLSFVGYSMNGLVF